MQHSSTYTYLHQYCHVVILYCVSFFFFFFWLYNLPDTLTRSWPHTGFLPLVTFFFAIVLKKGKFLSGLKSLKYQIVSQEIICGVVWNVFGVATAKLTKLYNERKQASKKSAEFRRFTESPPHPVYKYQPRADSSWSGTVTKLTQRQDISFNLSRAEHFDTILCLMIDTGTR